MEELKLNRTMRIEQYELLEKLKKEADNKKYKAVCFKMEDTLVVTPFSEITDIFVLMEEQFSGMSKSKRTFAEIRMKALESAEKKYAHNGNVTLEKVYDIIGTYEKLSKEQCNGLMETECELAIKYSFPRNCGTQVFQQAKKSKKRIVIVSESIYPKEIVLKILEKCGFDKYNEFILKSESGVTDNDSSALFDLALKKGKVSAEKMLNIGGNVSADVETPILKGSKALLLSPAIPLMVKSGRLRGVVQEKYLYDYESAEFLSLHILFGLYALYGFDIPQNKAYHSDFCGEAFLIGFIVLGGLSLIGEDYVPEKGNAQNVLKAVQSHPQALKGLEDFKLLYKKYFGESKFETKGCELPFEFLVKYASDGDRIIFKEYISEKDLKKWSDSIKEPKTATVYARQSGQNSVAKLADKMFPPNTKVRNMVDAILFKIKSR